MNNVVHLPGSVVDLGVRPIVRGPGKREVGLQIGRELIAEHGPGADQLDPVAGQDAQFLGRPRIGQ